MIKFLFLIFITILISCSNDQSNDLHQLFKIEWENRLKESPRMATSHGIHDSNHLLEDMSIEAIKRRVTFAKGILKRLHKIDHKYLSPDDQINYKVFESQLKHQIKEFEIKQYLIPINGDSGFHTGFVGVHKSMPFKTMKDYENYFERLLAFPKLVKQHVVHMREGLKQGKTLPKVVLNGYEVTYRSHFVKDLSNSLFYKPLNNFPNNFTDQEIKSSKRKRRRSNSKWSY